MPIRIFITKYEFLKEIFTIFSCGRLAGLLLGLFMLPAHVSSVANDDPPNRGKIPP